MRCFIHTVTDSEFIRDRDGEDFANRQMAEQEAAQVARDLMAEELRNGIAHARSVEGAVGLSR